MRRLFQLLAALVLVTGFMLFAKPVTKGFTRPDGLARSECPCPPCPSDAPINGRSIPLTPDQDGASRQP